jgi:hypothetical protein
MEVCQFVLLEGVCRWGREIICIGIQQALGMDSPGVCPELQSNLRLTNGTMWIFAKFDLVVKILPNRKAMIDLLPRTRHACV